MNSDGDCNCHQYDTGSLFTNFIDTSQQCWQKNIQPPNMMRLRYGNQNGYENPQNLNFTPCEIGNNGYDTFDEVTDSTFNKTRIGTMGAPFNYCGTQPKGENITCRYSQPPEEQIKNVQPLNQPSQEKFAIQNAGINTSFTSQPSPYIGLSSAGQSQNALWTEDVENSCLTCNNKETFCWNNWDISKQCGCITGTIIGIIILALIIWGLYCLFNKKCFKTTKQMNFNTNYAIL